MTCKVDDCAHRVHARGFCASHYMRWFRYGDPHHVPVKRSRTSVAVATRFWSKVDFSDPDGCWLWKGAKRHTYGEVILHGGKEYAHRVAFQLVYGELEDGLSVLHHCDTPLCVRPDHLFAGTQADNMRDMAAKDRWGNQTRRKPRLAS